MQPTVSRRRFPGHLAHLSVAATLLTAGCSKPASPPEPLPTVLVQPAAPGAPATEAWSGTVRSLHRATLAFAVAGRLAKTPVEVGDRVEAHSILAELEKEPFALELEQAEAQAQAAGPALEEAKRRHEAEERLSANRATSRAELDSAASAYASARSQQRAAQAALGLARRQERESRLIAPCNGRIAQRLAAAGSVIAAGTPVLEFDSEDGTEVLLILPGSRVSSLAIGQDARVSTGEPPGVVGRITQISQRSLAGGVHEVLIRLPENAGLFPGQPVAVELAARQPAAGVRLPLTAIRPDAESGSGKVLVFDPATLRLALRPVHYHAPHGADVLVSSGVSEGELVAVAGLEFLRAGQTVHAKTRESSALTSLTAVP